MWKPVRLLLASVVTVLALCTISSSAEAWSQSSSSRSRNTNTKANFTTRIKGGFTKQGRNSLLRSVARRMSISSNHLRRPQYYGLFHVKPKLERRSMETRYSNGVVFDGIVELTVPQHAPAVAGPMTLARPVKTTPETFITKQQRAEAAKKRTPLIRRLDLAVFCTYMSTAIAVNLPVVLLPMAAAEQVTAQGVSSLVAAITSVAIIGGGVGKVVNGFVCQEAGGKKSSSYYLLGCAFCSLLFSMASSQIGLAYAGMEFFASMQWTALSVILANHYAKDPASFAAGITIMSLSSTAGQLVAKALGMTLLQYFDWRTIARFGSLVAVMGALVVRTFIAERPAHVTPPKVEPFEWRRIGGSLKTSGRNVLTNPLFWTIGFAHAMAMLARSSDRVLGTLFQDVTSLPRSVCGGLTLSVTFGLVHGLVTGRTFSKLKSVSHQKAFVKRRYIAAVLSTLTLALFANPYIASFLSSKILMAVALVLSSGAMASAMSFQYFQIPNMLARTFGDNNAVCLSWLEAMAFFMNAPIWAMVGKMVPQLGWSAAFVMVAALFGVGGFVMVHAIPPVLEEQAA